MPYKRVEPKAPRISYAVETVVDRTIREQNRFLDYCLERKVELSILSMSGAMFNGIVHAYDRETILFGGRGKNATPRLIIKRFIALILPREEIELFVEYRGLGTARSRKKERRAASVSAPASSNGVAPHTPKRRVTTPTVE